MLSATKNKLTYFICLRRVLQTGALLVAKVPQNHRHASLTNNCNGSAIRRVNSLMLKQYTPLKFASPAIIARFRYRRIMLHKF